MLYSFVVRTKEEVTIPSLRIVIGPGRDMFNAELSDLEAFKTSLQSMGVHVEQINTLGVVGDAPLPALPSGEDSE